MNIKEPAHAQCFERIIDYIERHLGLCGKVRLFFHYHNLRSEVADHELLAGIYLPLKF